MARKCLVGEATSPESVSTISLTETVLTRNEDVRTGKLKTLTIVLCLRAIVEFVGFQGDVSREARH